MRRLTAFVSLIALLVAASACGGKKPKVDDAAPAAAASSANKIDLKQYEGRLQKPAELGQGIFGYNEPLEDMWMNGVGLRAVAQDRAIAVSIHNRTGSPITMTPYQFRLLLPDRTLYEFKGDRNDLLWFPERPILHGGREVFVVGVPDLPQLIGLKLVYNYPPKKVLLRAEVEPVGLVSGPQ